ncbi:MAG: hypothetical protein ACK5MG_10430 [Bacteroidales bacterium]
MNKLNTVFQVLFVSAFAFFASCEPATISGVWERTHDESISLFKVVDGHLEEIGTSNLDENKGFAFAIPKVDEGFYVIGVKDKPRVMKRVIQQYTFYLKPGD